MIEAAKISGLSQPQPIEAKAKVGAPGFLEELKKATAKDIGPTAPLASSLKFSAHAVDRMQSRGIRFSQEQMGAIEGAISKASQKGAKDTLVIAGDQAMIVSVKNNTVVTVMDRASMKENVFTNIDSTVVI